LGRLGAWDGFEMVIGFGEMLRCVRIGELMVALRLDKDVTD
jgi:hypothetical protein